MNNLSGKSTGLAVAVLVLGLCLMSGAIQAETFVSYNGEFHFSYPESWAQVDYTTAEYYLTRNNPEEEVDFEAVFSEKQTFSLFQGQYMILTVDTLGARAIEAADSVVEQVSEEFGRPIKEVSPEEFLSASLIDTIAFDRANNLLGIESEVAGGDAGPRISLLVMKLYEYGIANYYFYAPKVEYLPSLATYRDMVTSHSTRAIEETTQEEVRVADLEDDDNNGVPIAIYGGLAAVLIAIIAQRRRSRAKKN